MNLISLNISKIVCDFKLLIKMLLQGLNVVHSIVVNVQALIKEQKKSMKVLIEFYIQRIH